MTLKPRIKILLVLLSLSAGLHFSAYASQSPNYSTKQEQHFEKGKKYLDSNNPNQAIEFLKKAANAGHEQAQSLLGITYYQQKLYEKARLWLRKRSEAGDADAQYYYANTFRYALGTSAQPSVARRLYQKAARQDHVNAQFELGKMFQDGIGANKNTKLAINWYKSAANKGHLQAKQALALLEPLENVDTAQPAKPVTNRSQTKNQIADKTVDTVTPKKSVDLHSGAIDGDAEQQFRLAMRYMLGYETDSDEKQAIYWLTQAAGQQHAMAQYYLGDQYLKGKNVEQNIVLAIRYFLKAENKGIIAAKTALKALNDYGYANIVQAEKGDSQFQFQMAMEYLNDNAKTDKTIAVEWLTAAAAQSHIPALLQIGQMYEYGEVVGQDDKKAFDAYQKAAELNNPEAQYNLGKMYKAGKGTVANLSMAISWITKAAKQGLPAAQKELQISEL